MNCIILFGCHDILSFYHPCECVSCNVLRLDLRDLVRPQAVLLLVQISLAVLQFYAVLPANQWQKFCLETLSLDLNTIVLNCDLFCAVLPS